MIRDDVPRVAVGAIIVDNVGRVLLVQRWRPPGEGLWTVPGGRVEHGETLEAALVREVREETGLDVSVGPLAEVVERMGADYHFVILDYACRVLGGTLRAGDDARDARFVDEAELAALPCTEGLVAVIARARATHAAWFASP